MHRDAGRWNHGRGIHSSILSKGEQRGRRCLFAIGLGLREFLVWRRIFVRISPNFHEKFFVQLVSTNSIPRRSWRLFGVISKKGSCDFLRTLGAMFWSQARLGAIFTQIFGNVSKIFGKSKLLGVNLPPPPTSTTVFYI